MIPTLEWQNEYAQELGYDDAEQMYYELQDKDYQEMVGFMDKMLHAYLKHKVIS